jgi:hypothetical protein
VVISVAPVVGAVYRQELPGALAQTLCANGDCIVTREFTPISPDHFERKYCARGVGLFLEVNPEDREVVTLTQCNFAAVCDKLD